MSTTITSLYNKTLTISPSIVDGSHEVTIEASGTASGNYRLSDLLAALRAEGILPAEPEPLAEWEWELLHPDRKIVPADALVIHRGDLPHVETRDDGTILAVNRLGDGSTYGPPTIVPPGRVVPDALRGQAAARLALAEYLDANPPKPPVDEAMVQSLADIVSEEHAWGRVVSEDIARRLYLAGVRIEATS